jgi:cystathionine gamma-synthase
MKKLHQDTLTATALSWVDEETDAMISPLRPSTSFLRDPNDLDRAGRMFTRDDNPTYQQPEALINELEGGAGCLLFASGMASITSVFHILNPGDHVILPVNVYSGLRDWLNQHGLRWGLEISFLKHYDANFIEKALIPGKTKLVWIETPSNPTWDVSDIAAISKVAHQARALVAIDNTVSTPILTRPIEHGVDIVVHSGSKYLNGHGDVIAGALIVAPGQESVLQKIKAIRNEYGGVLGTFEAWLLLRGMRTLAVRVKTACSNAMVIAQFLDTQANVKKVLYCGLETHAGHEIASRQMQGGFGAMLSVQVDGGEIEAKKIASKTCLIRQAISFGSTETVIEHRAGMEGVDSPTPRDLLRMSIGIENVDDIIADLKQALSYTLEEESEKELETP